MIALLVSLCLLSAAEDVPASAPVVMGGADAKLMAEVRAIAEHVEELRGRRFQRPPIALRSTPSLREVAAEIRAYRDVTRERLAARGRAWADIGLGGAGTPARVLEFLARDLEGVAFDSQGNRLLIAENRLTERDFRPRNTDDPDATLLMMTGVRPDEPLVSHALTHAMQRERGGVNSFRETTDAMLAGAACAEGEANLVAVRLLFAGMGLADEVLQQRLDLNDLLQGQLLPLGLNSLSGVEYGMLGFVYLDGFDRVAAWYRQGGWPAVERGVAGCRATRSVLHATDAPAALEWPEEGAPAAGLQRVDSDTLGEQAVVVLVSTLTGKDNLGLMAGDGWVGDRLERWEGADAGWTRWTSLWATEQAARDFVYGFGRTLRARFPGASLEPAAGDDRRLHAAGKTFHVQLDGTRVRILVGPRATEDATEP
ncbi:MAG: hypothetical protein GY716_14460 [bacterium]|nr:hypothetical protein [bacterium]